MIHDHPGTRPCGLREAIKSAATFAERLHGVLKWDCQKPVRNWAKSRPAQSAGFAGSVPFSSLCSTPKPFWNLSKINYFNLCWILLKLRNLLPRLVSRIPSDILTRPARCFKCFCTFSSSNSSGARQKASRTTGKAYIFNTCQFRILFKHFQIEISNFIFHFAFSVFSQNSLKT